MGSHKIKADVALEFHGWIDKDEKPVLDLVGTEDELNISTVFNGKVDVSASKLYEVLREQKENGRRPLFVLNILDDEPKPLPIKKDDEQPGLPMDQPKPKTPAQQKIIDQERKLADKKKDGAAENKDLTKPRNV